MIRHTHATEMSYRQCDSYLKIVTFREKCHSLENSHCGNKRRRQQRRKQKKMNDAQTNRTYIRYI